MTKSAIVKFDGGVRPTNPGPAAIGYILEGDDWSEEGNEHIGESTNNQAEYRSLIRGLEVASEKGCTQIVAKGDSQLVVNQVRGEWNLNEPELRPLRDRAQELAEEFDSFEIQHVSRDENWEADELVDQAFSD
jgi:ribonuclease HI